MMNINDQHDQHYQLLHINSKSTFQLKQQCISLQGSNNVNCLNNDHSEHNASNTSSFIHLIKSKKCNLSKISKSTLLNIFMREKKNKLAIKQIRNNGLFENKFLQKNKLLQKTYHYIKQKQNQLKRLNFNKRTNRMKNQLRKISTLYQCKQLQQQDQKQYKKQSKQTKIFNELEMIKNILKQCNKSIKQLQQHYSRKKQNRNNQQNIMKQSRFNFNKDTDNKNIENNNYKISNSNYQTLVNLKFSVIKQKQAKNIQSIYQHYQKMQNNLKQFENYYHQNYISQSQSHNQCIDDQSNQLHDSHINENQKLFNNSRINASQSQYQQKYQHQNQKSANNSKINAKQSQPQDSQDSQKYQSQSDDQQIFVQSDDQQIFLQSDDSYINEQQRSFDNSRNIDGEQEQIDNSQVIEKERQQLSNGKRNRYRRQSKRNRFNNSSKKNRIVSIQDFDQKLKYISYIRLHENDFKTKKIRKILKGYKEYANPNKSLRQICNSYWVYIRRQNNKSIRQIIQIIKQEYKIKQQEIQQEISKIKQYQQQQYKLQCQRINKQISISKKQISNPHQQYDMLFQQNQSYQQIYQLKKAKILFNRFNQHIQCTRIRGKVTSFTKQTQSPPKQQQYDFVKQIQSSHKYQQHPNLNQQQQQQYDYDLLFITYLIDLKININPILQMLNITQQMLNSQSSYQQVEQLLKLNLNNKIEKHYILDMIYRVKYNTLFNSNHNKTKQIKQNHHNQKLTIQTSNNINKSQAIQEQKIQISQNKANKTYKSSFKKYSPIEKKQNEQNLITDQQFQKQNSSQHNQQQIKQWSLLIEIKKLLIFISVYKSFFESFPKVQTNVLKQLSQFISSRTSLQCSKKIQYIAKNFKFKNIDELKQIFFQKMSINKEKFQQQVKQLIQQCLKNKLQIIFIQKVIKYYDHSKSASSNKYLEDILEKFNQTAKIQLILQK